MPMSKKREANDRRLRRLVYAQRAFKNAIAMCEFAMKHDLASEPNWYPTAVTGICTDYMRPFVSADGLGPLPTRYSEFEDKAFAALHRDLDLGRNWLFAHHDMLNTPTLLQPEDADVYKRVKVRIFPGNNFQCAIQPVKFSPKNLPQVVQLCELQNARINEEMKETIFALLETAAPKTYQTGEYVLGETFP